MRVCRPLGVWVPCPHANGHCMWPGALCTHKAIIATFTYNNNNKINRIHERALQIAYKDYESSLNTLLEKDDSVSIHAKNLQTLLIEMFKAKENINPPFMKENFCERTVTYNLRNNNEFLLPMVRTTSYGSETIKCRGQRLWLSLPQHIRNAQSINEFKKEIKSWNGTDCTCRLCRAFIPPLGFL